MGANYKTASHLLSICIAFALAADSTSIASSVAQTPQSTQGPCQRFEQMGQQVCGRFLEYWQQNGGLAQQGYPISAPMQERSDTDGKTYTVQYFERAVFEAHPGNARPYDVLLTLLGSIRLKEKYPQGVPGDAATLPTSKATMASCTPTHGDDRSPTYIENAPVRSSVAKEHAVSGSVLSSVDCAPIAGAKLEMWPDVEGDHPGRYRATLFADKNGRYRFEGPAGDHIHMRISAYGYIGIFSNAYHQVKGQAEGIFDVVLAPDPGCTLFKETGRSVCGQFLEYWQRNGGLAQQGYPITQEFQEKSDLDGKTYTVQYFERAVFEKHPENKPPFDVLLSLLGRFRYNQKYNAQGTPRPAAGPTAQVGGQLRAGQGRWTTKAPIPTPRSEVAVAEVNGKIYVLGGFSAKGQAVHEEYDPAADRWRSRATMPQPLNHAGAVGLNGKLYMIGGYTEAGRAIAATYEYDPATDKWRSLAPMPTARGALGVAVLDGKIYAVGGRADADVNANEAYDPTTDRWARLAAMPTARDHLGVAALGGKIYAVGGRFETFARNTGLNEVYDPATGRWQTRAPMPTPRSGIAAIALAGYMLVFGGEETQGTFEENEAYNPATDSWMALAPMPTARHGIGAAIVGNVIYIPSGGPTPGGSQIEVHEAFTLE